LISEIPNESTTAVEVSPGLGATEDSHISEKSSSSGIIVLQLPSFDFETKLEVNFEEFRYLDTYISGFELYTSIGVFLDQLRSTMEYNEDRELSIAKTRIESFRNHINDIVTSEQQDYELMLSSGDVIGQEIALQKLSLFQQMVEPYFNAVSAFAEESLRLNHDSLLIVTALKENVVVDDIIEENKTKNLSGSLDSPESDAPFTSSPPLNQLLWEESKSYDVKENPTNDSDMITKASTERCESTSPAAYTVAIHSLDASSGIEPVTVQSPVTEFQEKNLNRWSLSPNIIKFMNFALNFSSILTNIVIIVISLIIGLNGFMLGMVSIFLLISTVISALLMVSMVCRRKLDFAFFIILSAIFIIGQSLNTSHVSNLSSYNRQQ
jgi:hypothetical protein